VVVFKRAEALGSFGTVGLSLLGGAVFPTSALPHWLQPVATVVPTRFAFNAVRHALFGKGDWLGPTLALVGIGAALMALSLVLFAAALRLVVRQGTVSQY
jgi:ABC-type multidrug transport system permease subunit